MGLVAFLGLSICATGFYLHLARLNRGPASEEPLAISGWVAGCAVASAGLLLGWGKGALSVGLMTVASFVGIGTLALVIGGFFEQRELPLRFWALPSWSMGVTGGVERLGRTVVALVKTGLEMTRYALEGESAMLWVLVILQAILLAFVRSSG
jgi:hypothetical protein